MQSQTYNYKVVRQFAIMTVVWGIVGMLVGVIVAAPVSYTHLDVYKRQLVHRPLPAGCVKAGRGELTLQGLAGGLGPVGAPALFELFRVDGLGRKRGDQLGAAEMMVGVVVDLAEEEEVTLARLGQ